MTIKNEVKHELPLRLNLQHFAEEGTNNEGTNANPSDATKNTNEGVNHTNNSAPAQQSTNTEHMIPKSRFDEVNSKFKEVQAQLDQLLAAKAEDEKRSQEEQGKFKELYEGTNNELSSIKTKYEQTETRAKELESVINGLLETRLANIDEQFHDLIPSNLTSEQKLEWINKAEQKGLFGKKAQAPVGEGTNPSQTQAIDVGKMSVIQLLKAGYGAK